MSTRCGTQYGPGVIRALRIGFERAEPGPVIVLMGDLSDKLSIVPEMLGALARRRDAGEPLALHARRQPARRAAW